MTRRSSSRIVVIAAMAAIVGCAVSICGGARADTPPSAWDNARDPQGHDRWRLHVRVEQLLHARTDDPTGLRIDENRDRELRAEAALALLEGADAAKSPDVRLRFDLGAVEFELGELQRRNDYYTKAVATLTAAVAAAPDDPAVTDALERIAYCYAKLDRSREELDAWHRYIPRIVDPRSRAINLMNMGEAEMRLGLVDDALATLREVLRESAELPDTSSTYVLTLWDLAVAQDRSGDPRAALETATKASHVTAISSHGVPATGRAILTHDDGVFFVPAWERLWYLALGSTALAREDTDPREALAYWVEAEAEWSEYIAQATAAGGTDRWLPIAKLRRDRVKAERIAANKRVPKGAPRPIGADDP
jgi:tetratricopeptide (TPR) repeat protein